MSLHDELHNRIEAARKQGLVDDEALGARWTATALHRALLALEPETLRDAGIHAAELKNAIGALPIASGFTQQLEPLATALRNLEAALEELRQSTQQAPSGIHAAAVRELDGIGLIAVGDAPIEDRRRGDALERVIMSTPPRTLAEAAIVAELACRWIRDLTAPPTPGISRQLETLEYGADALSLGLHRLAGVERPADRPSFALMGLAA